jgi:hypothetical protein
MFHTETVAVITRNTKNVAKGNRKTIIKCNINMDISTDQHRLNVVTVEIICTVMHPDDPGTQAVKMY